MVILQHGLQEQPIAYDVFLNVFMMWVITFVNDKFQDKLVFIWYLEGIQKAVVSHALSSPLKRPHLNHRDTLMTHMKYLPDLDEDNRHVAKRAH